MTGPDAPGPPTPATADAVLRPMRWWDVEAAAALERDLFAGTAWSPETFWSELARPDSRWYTVATAGDVIIGYAGLMTSDGAEADVQTVAVAPSAQGRGLGSRLVGALVDEALRRGAGALLLEVAADNAGAIALYSSLGFERIAVRRGYYGPGGDAWVMRCRPLRGRGESDRPLRGRGESDRPLRGRGESDRPLRGRGESDRPLRGRGESDRPLRGRGESP
jgi:ribosomal-protein-alanine N-acetyltransferase